jgi:hypothetical protein
MRFATFLAFFAMSSLVIAQGTIFVPDNNAGAGTCNAIPLQASFAAATTYLARVPASYMDPALRRVDDIAFAPCNGGTFSAPSLQMGLGHVPTPLPLPFVYPTFDLAGNVTALGSFIDYQPLWNSVSQGPFSFQMTGNAWSPMGFATGGGTTGFVWNGTNDVGYYLTHSGSTGGDTCHRTATEPFRAYNSGTYQAAASNGSGAAGLKMEFFVSAAVGINTIGFGCAGTNNLVPTLSTNELPSLGNLAFHVDVSQGLGGSSAALYLSIGIASSPLSIGGGCNVYLDLPSVLAFISSGFVPIGPLTLDAAGAGVFFLPIPPDPNLNGIHAGIQAVVVDPVSVVGFTLTNALEAVLG